MKKLAIAALFLLSSVFVAAQSTIPVTGQKVVDNNLKPLTGQLLFTVTNSSDTPITYTPQGGSATTATIAIPVVKGAVQTVGGFPAQIPNPATMSPANSLYRLQVQATGGGTNYFTFPLVNITQAFFSYDGYAVPAGVTASGMGLPKIPCSPHAQYNNTLASDPYPWVCSQFTGDSSVYWTQNPSLNPACAQGNNQAIASSLTGATFCIDASQAFVTPGFVWAGPTAGAHPSQIGLVPVTTLCAGGACGAGGTPAAPQYAVQFAGPSATAFNADSTFTFNAASHALSAFQTNGGFNSDVAATGGGNNGIANLIAGPCAGIGCLFARPQTSTDTENIAGSLNSAGDYTHAIDSLYGTATHYFWNSGINTAGSNGNRDANPSYCWWNDQPALPTAKSRCNSKYTYYLSPGEYITGSPAGVSSHNEITYTYGRSVSQNDLSQFYAYHVGDAADLYHYFHYRGGAIQGNDEGDEGWVLNSTEEPPPFGTVSTGGANATVVKSNFTRNGNQGDGYRLIDTQTAVSSGNITATSLGSGRLLNSVTTSDTHATSTGYATLSGACGTASARNVPVTSTCNITIVSGSFSAAANATVCVGDYGQPEQAAVSAVGTNTITMGMTYAHITGTPIYQGGGCGLKLALGNGASTPFDANHNLTNYWIAGSKTATSYDVIVVFKSGQNGNVLPPLATMPTVQIGAISRVGGVVTATVDASQPNYNYNLYVAPSASAITIAGATPSDLNGTVTGTAFNSQTGKMTWNQAGADESGSGGTISVVGLNNYFAYCGAETVRVLGSSFNLGGGVTLDGTLQLEPNNCPWTPGDAVTQAGPDVVTAFATRIGNTAITKPLASPNTGNAISLSGVGNSGAIENAVFGGDLLSSQIGYGGSILPHTYLNSTGFYKTTFQFSYPPIDNGVLFNIGVPPEGALSSSATYSLFSLGAAGKVGLFTFNPANATFGMNVPFLDTVSISGGAAIGVAGGGQTPGTSGYGGWLVPEGDSSLSANFNTLVAGNGLAGDSSGTLGAKYLVAPQIIAGAPAPANFITFQHGAAGSTTYSYACTAVTANGESTAGTSTTNTGNATLSATNSNNPKCFGVPGAQSLNIYRTAGGATQGKIANIANGANLAGATAFFDTGLTGDGTSPPTKNNTGKVTVYGLADGCVTITSSILGSTTCGGGGGVSSIDTQTGAFTFGGAGVSHVGNSYTFSGGSGVTSVAQTVPSWLTVTGSPIATSGTLAITATTGQAANQFLATPYTSSGPVGLRTINAADLPVGSAAALGIVKVDGTTITAAGGVISATSSSFITSLTTTGTSGAATVGSGVLNIPNYTYSLPLATTSVLGGVMCDGTTITCTSGVITAIAGGTGTVTHTGNLTTGFVMLGNGTADSKVSTSLDDGITTATTITSTEPIAAPSFATNGPTPGAMGVAAGTGSIPALAANSAGFAAPVTGGTSYRYKLPATAAAGVLHAAAPGTVDGVNESALTAGAVSLTAEVSGILPVANGGTGTATPALVQGTNVTITGSWPNQTISASGSGGSYTPPALVQSMVADPAHSRWDVLGLAADTPYGGTATGTPWITTPDAAGFWGSQLTTGTTINTSAGWYGGNGLVSSNPSMQAIFGLGASTSVQSWVGFCFSSCFSATNVLDPSSAGTQMVAFRYFAGTDTSWTCYASNGANSTTSSSGVAVDATKQQIFRIMYVSGTPEYFINNTRVCSGMAFTYPPASTTVLSTLVGWQNTTTTGVTGILQSLQETEY
ncbi:MAG TPA: hypothetical protein VGU67_03010 [Edaphobacter sp.]|nr:hypothetical protein [Edaphobacter sp.]